MDNLILVGYISASSKAQFNRGNAQMGLLNFLPKEEQYFALFIQMTVYISEAARELKEMLADKNHDYHVYAQRIKGLEHACDDLTHSISTRLNKSFITPFDREDIYAMAAALDDIVDLIDDAAMAIIIFDVKEIKDYAQDFAGVIVRMAEQLKAIVSTLQRPKNITPRLVEIHRLGIVAREPEQFAALLSLSVADRRRGAFRFQRLQPLMQSRVHAASSFV